MKVLPFLTLGHKTNLPIADHGLSIFYTSLRQSPSSYHTANSGSLGYPNTPSSAISTLPIGMRVSTFIFLTVSDSLVPFNNPSTTASRYLCSYYFGFQVLKTIFNSFSRLVVYRSFCLFNTRQVILLQEARCIQNTKERILTLSPTLTNFTEERSVVLLVFLFSFKNSSDNWGV